jgi:hypothetical protein
MLCFGERSLSQQNPNFQKSSPLPRHYTYGLSYLGSLVSYCRPVMLRTDLALTEVPDCTGGTSSAYVTIWRLLITGKFTGPQFFCSGYIVNLLSVSGENKRRLVMSPCYPSVALRIPHPFIMFGTYEDRLAVSAYSRHWFFHFLRDLCCKKLSPLTGCGGLQGCETLRIPHCLDSRLTDGVKVVSPTHRPSFTPHKYCFSLCVLILLEAE